MATMTIGTRVAWLVALILGAGGLSVVPVGTASSALGDTAPSHWAGIGSRATARPTGAGWRVPGQGRPGLHHHTRARPNTRGYTSSSVVGNYRDSEVRLAARPPARPGSSPSTAATATQPRPPPWTRRLPPPGRRAVAHHGSARRPACPPGRASRARCAGSPGSARRQAAKSAGVYGVAITSTGADVGGTVTGTVTVTTGGGNPASGLPVTFTSPGADPVGAVTGDDGVALARFPAPASGWQRITATVSQVPEHRLHLLAPKRRHQATAAKGGVSGRSPPGSTRRSEARSHSH